MEWRISEKEICSYFNGGVLVLGLQQGRVMRLTLSTHTPLQPPRDLILVYKLLRTSGQKSQLIN